MKRKISSTVQQWSTGAAAMVGAGIMDTRTILKHGRNEVNIPRLLK